MVGFIKLNSRQEKIVDIVKEHQPITGEQIGALLQVSRATLRADLSILTMFRILDARPKVGYFYLGPGDLDFRTSEIAELAVSDVMTRPVLAKQENSIYDLVVKLFLEDTSNIYVTDEQDRLCGLVSRKDLLKVTLSGADLHAMPVAMVMTRVPNIVTVRTDTSVRRAAALLVKNRVDSLPVLSFDENEPDDASKWRLVGKFSKTVISNLFVEVTQIDE
ncbi:helix-turn-helix transcriptional regulator [Streptococcus gallolyticus]|uniref:helix-turn-helix transcriptional regulator n=1 Tax=Streptococcus hepaticus TaxID=3349163 RepID=UPI001C958A72|nr:helix-turn-helix transcriptional regulator [Streptococcus gallolyticus]MBY5041730.1 helix-turn-helix transcriptional regulator [Streptococcus gallolyticus]